VRPVRGDWEEDHGEGGGLGRGSWGGGGGLGRGSWGGGGGIGERIMGRGGGIGERIMGRGEGLGRGIWGGGALEEMRGRLRRGRAGAYGRGWGTWGS
jgi:hypothetical protein